MQTANIMLALGGDTGNTIPKYEVTASEIAVLNAIHGDGAVTEIDPLGEIDRTDRAEVNRLRVIYGRAKDGDDKALVDILFPGAAAPAFRTLKDLDLDSSFFKAVSRASAEPFGGKGDHDSNGAVGGAAPTQATGLNGMKVPELRALAEGKNIDLGDATKKADIIAKIEAAGAPVEDEVVEDEEDDEVEDLTDNGVLG
jgi:hypothetical protein